MTSPTPEAHVPAHHEGGSPSVLSALTRKLGPLPGWAWVVIVVALAYLYKRFRGGSTTAPATTTTATTPDTATADTTSPGSYGAGLWGVTQGTTDQNPTVSQPSATPTTTTTAAPKVAPIPVVHHGSATVSPHTAAATHAVSKAKPSPKPGPRTYVVKSGDSLSSIAQHFYGSPSWEKIYTANHAAIGSNPNLIHPGTRLVIPT